VIAGHVSERDSLTRSLTDLYPLPALKDLSFSGVLATPP
jgi:hypothetical protein